MTESKALAVVNDMPLAEIAVAFVKSGFFQDVTDVNKAIVKIMAGREFGFGPFASMTGVHIIQGRPAPAANLMAAAVKASGRYDYRVRQMDDKACRIEFFERMGGKLESLGTSEFTDADARKAGTKNMDKYPRNMLFARAMSNGVKWYTPDVFNGVSVYTPEELGAETDADGNVIEGESRLAPPPQIEQPTSPPALTNGHNDALPPSAEALDALGDIMAKAAGMGIDIGQFEAAPRDTTGEARQVFKAVRDAIKAHTS